MKSVQAYMFSSNDKKKNVSFIIDFLMNDEIGTHKYYLVSYGDSTDIKKVASIDKVIEYFDRERMEYVELNSKQSLGLLFSTIDYSLNKNAENSNDAKEEVFNFPGVVPINETDVMLLNKNGGKYRAGGELDESKHGKK